MPVRKSRRRLTPQSGFSMIEMLMAAFILAIGILGLTMLQVMSLRTTRGSQNLGIAVQLAERVMDQVELEGRLTFLNQTYTMYNTPSTLGGITYISKGTVDQYYKINPTTGQPVQTATAADALFHIQMTGNDKAYGTVGLLDVTVLVEFTDEVSAGNSIKRTATITRRILHA